jgi:hypothetical protein
MMAEGTGSQVFPRRHTVECLDWALVIASLAVTATVYFFYILNTDLLMTSEQASDVLAGMEMLRQKTVFLRDWFYADELFTIRSPLFVAFSGIFAGSSYLWSHRLSVFIELALEVTALVYMIRRIGLTGRTGLLVLALFFGARSYQSGHLCGMGFAKDASFHTALFLAIGYLAAGAAGVRKRAERTLKYAHPVMAFLFGLSSASMLALLYLPLLIHRLWRAAVARDASRGNGGGAEANRGDLLGEIAIWNACFMAGYLILAFAVADQGHGPVLLTSGESAGFFYAIAANLPHMLGQFADGSPLAAVRGSDAFTSLGWYAGLSFFGLVLIVLWKTPWALKMVSGAAGGAMRALLFCISGSALLTCVHLETDRSDVRYVQFMYPYAAILLASLCAGLASGGRPRLGRLLLRFLAFAVLAIGTSNMLLLPRLEARNPSLAVSRHTPQIVGFLLQNGITSAYSLYWDAYTLQVMSSGTVKAGAVDGRMRPFLKNASLTNYSQSPTATKVAFVRSMKPRPWAEPALEFADNSASFLDISAGQIEIEDNSNPLRVYVFYGNPFSFAAVSERDSGLAQEGMELRPKGSPGPGVRTPESDSSDGPVKDGDVAGASGQGEDGKGSENSDAESDSAGNAGKGAGQEGRAEQGADYYSEAVSGLDSDKNSGPGHDSEGAEGSGGVSGNSEGLEVDTGGSADQGTDSEETPGQAADSETSYGSTAGVAGIEYSGHVEVVGLLSRTGEVMPQKRADCVMNRPDFRDETRNIMGSSYNPFNQMSEFGYQSRFGNVRLIPSPGTYLLRFATKSLNRIPPFD